MNSSSIIITALEEQVDCYRRLAKLAQLQHEHVQQGRTDELLAVLSRRQVVLDQVVRLEQSVTSARRNWGEFIRALDATDRSRIERAITETRLLLEQITLADRDDALVLQQRKLSVGQEMNRAGVARQVNRTYAAAAYGATASRLNVTK